MEQLHLQVDGTWWGPATYYPTPRARHHEPLRPAPSDLRPLATRIPQVSLFDHDIWADLEVHRGTAGWYRQRHGNLRRDNAQVVLGRALAAGGRPADTLWFDLDPLPGVAELAARHGDSSGQGVHLTATSVRYRWLDRAQRAHRG